MHDALHIIFPLYAKVTQLDFTGPYEVFSRLPGARCTLASVEGGPLKTDTGLCFAELTRLDAVTQCDVLCVPGGYGTIEAMEDEAFLVGLRRLGAQARYVTSVCTGSLLLGAAGLLRGKRATSHWAWIEFLELFGARAEAGRVVRDGNVFSGGGVTAGIDLGLTVMAEIAGADYAQAVQLALEYAPAPPFSSGTPESASPEVVAMVRSVMNGAAEDRAARLKAVASKTIETKHQNECLFG